MDPAVMRGTEPPTGQRSAGTAALPGAPDISYAGSLDSSFRPSWSSSNGFVNDEHREIWQNTKDLPGWQDPPDSQKLYEMAFHSGGCILEIGMFGGRSAVVELRGALRAASARGLEAPQWYGIDVDPAAIPRTLKTLKDSEVDRYALVYHGDLAHFHRDIPITPSMVFVDGDHHYAGVWADLHLLRQFLAAGTPVLCHDYQGIADVKRAVDEWIGRGYYEPMGVFAGSVLLRCTRACTGRVGRLEPSVFDHVRGALLERYSGDGGIATAAQTPVRGVTAMARQYLQAGASALGSDHRSAWPLVAPQSAPLPETMPGGYPWPRISIVTPSFNQGQFIEQTILSVLQQGYPNVEHIIVDGGSTDETQRVLERYRDRVACCISEKDTGQSNAINKGFAKASGEILTWLNSDDMLAPGALAAVALAMQRSGADMVAGVCQLLGDGRVTAEHLTSCASGAPLPLAELLDAENRWFHGQFFYQPEVMFRRGLWEKAGARVDEALYYSMDYELWLRFAEQGAKLHVIGRPVAQYRVHAGQKTYVSESYREELLRTRDAYVARTGATAAVPPAGKEPRPNLRVVFFNDIGFRLGAGLAHGRLAAAMHAAGHVVVPLAALPSSENTETGAACRNQDVTDAIGSSRPDLVILGNLHGAGLDPALIGLIAQRWPTAMVMHDLWAVTGRCAYAGECPKYATAGGCDAACPTSFEYPKLPPEEIHGAWDTKQMLYRGSCPPVLLANSTWTMSVARKALDATTGALSRMRPTAPTATIRYAIPLNVFCPRDQMTCREAFGLPVDKFLILFSASSLDDKRKGVAHLVEALKMLNLPDVATVCVGYYDGTSRPDLPDLRIMGYMENQLQLAMLYSAVDLFVGPSTEEALGQVFVEAAACGTPSVGYPVGGVKEAIADGISGRLAASVGSAALADAIEELYSDADLRQSMRRWGRIHVENEWSMHASAHRMHVVLQQTGLGARCGLGRKITFPAEPGPMQDLAAVRPRLSWRPLAGFGPMEGPYPQWKLPRCRWLYGPFSRMELDVPEAGKYRLMLAVRNPHKGQHVQVLRDGEIVCEQEVPYIREGRQYILSWDMELPAGRSVCEMRYWKWDPPERSERPLAMLVLDVALTRWS